RKVDIRADIYSLGCTLYYLLVGRPPFPKGSFFDKAMAHREETPRPITELRKEVPAGVVQVLDRMMAKDPAKRYQTPSAVAQALAPFAGASSAATVPYVRPETTNRVVETPDSRGWRRKAVVGSVVLAVVGIATAVLYAVKDRGNTGPGEQTPV